MSRYTDAERAELLQDAQAAGFGRIVDGVVGLPPAWWGQDISALEAFDKLRAARRAPVAPVPQRCKPVPVELLERIQESLGSFVSDQGWSQSDMDTADALGGLLAAAPQPPEAAPVELPEPVAFVHTPALVWNGKIRPVVSFAKYEDDYKSGIYSLRTPLYTEHQVREILKAHGINVKKSDGE